MGEVSGGVADTASLAETRATGLSSAYLLVVEQGGSKVVPLPEVGMVTIGRAPDVEVVLEHASVSRRHARIVIDRGEVRITDLDSHNGTRVNGEPLAGGRVLTTGDVVAIGEVILVVHAELARAPSYMVLDEATWRRRLGEEILRAVAFQRPLALLAIEHPTLAFPVEPIAGLRTIDVIGRVDDHHLVGIMPEADADAASALARVVSRSLATKLPGARIGIATCPADAVDADNLLLAARAAAAVAPVDGVATLADAVERRRFGERQVLVAHPAMRRVFDLIKRLAAASVPVLIIGETGVGKENAAFAVHHDSPRRDRPFIAVNCAALPEALVESELFGHNKGAFTGATAARAGVLEAASGGTLFLDEIGELALPVQAKLLRALENQTITRVGEHRERAIDVRIVAATHRVLEDEVKAGRFRQDLYFRLGAAHVHLLPLRDRRCEIPLLFRELVRDAATRAARVVPAPTAAVMQRLLQHGWPGNVRELKHVAEFVVATVEDDRIEPSDLPPELAAQVSAAPKPAPPPRDPDAPMRRLADELEELERQRMTEALAKTNGIKTRAAALLGMPIRTFNMKFRQYGL